MWRKLAGDATEKAAPEAAGVRAAMEEPPFREEEGEEEEEGDEAGPEGALRKSPFQLTAEDVYDISYVMGRELMALGSDPRVTQLQFKVVRVLEMLETLVNEGNLTLEALRMERDSLRKEVEGLRAEGAAAGPEVSARGWEAAALAGRPLSSPHPPPGYHSEHVAAGLPCSGWCHMMVNTEHLPGVLGRVLCSKPATSCVFDLEQEFSSFNLNWNYLDCS